MHTVWIGVFYEALVIVSAGSSKESVRNYIIFICIYLFSECKQIVPSNSVVAAATTAAADYYLLQCERAGSSL